MKFRTGLLAAALLGLTAAPPAHAETLRVGMECTYAPFNYRTPDGQMAGYDVDVAKGIAERIGGLPALAAVFAVAAGGVESAAIETTTRQQRTSSIWRSPNPPWRSPRRSSCWPT